MPLNALRAFDAVGQNLSFTAGATALSVSQSAMSRHVIGLEELLGKQLFDRTSAKLSLTQAGAELLPVVSKCLDRLEHSMNSVRSDTVQGRALRIHIPPSLLQQLVLPMLRDFRAEHPEIRLDVSSTYVTGMPPANLDMAIVFDRPNVDDHITDLLWKVRVAPLCSPATRQNADAASLQDLMHKCELLHIKLDDEPRDLLWTIFARQHGLEFASNTGLAFDTAISAAQYAMTSNGLFLGDFDMFAQEIVDGRLEMPYATAADDGYGYYLKLHADDLSDPAIALFRSWLIHRFSALTRSE